ncbi:MAG: UDP-N-acetylglucosamine--N-acetylmuramyl-(pentapeptide) pyrophosphoryl-undecaprenol N-acetylglucosamine transferase [Clostridia bacterium]|nr:UDP-N-acetylglucosamine--N-acetylmuramyl-(pentapeptide) pyrophosphoryl-undecaprenol N-acetylglucosamine transferase [Clostridia bacterium]
MRILFTGGGTGGHINPALSIAETVKENIPDSVIAFAGTKRGLENTLVPRAGYPLWHVNVRGFERKFSLKNIRAAWLALVSPLRAARIVREFRPDIVIGTGGYVCWPVLVAASRAGIPTAVHESNAVPGLTVRKLAPYVDRIFINFSVTADALGEGCARKIMHVGCPLSGEIGKTDRQEARRRLGYEGKYRRCLLSFGGSLGAGKMNDVAFEMMDRFVSNHPDVHYIHATGADYYDSCRARFVSQGYDRYPNIELVKYIYDMPLQLAAADLVICRSGAITCSELARAGRGALLIPSPNVTDNQQYKNAMVLEKCGGAVVTEEKDLEPGLLSGQVEKIFSVPGFSDRMGQNLARLSPSDANRLIFEEIVRLVRKG